MEDDDLTELDLYEYDLLDMMEEELYDRDLFELMDSDDEVLCDRSRYELESNRDCLKALKNKEIKKNQLI